MAKKPLVDTEQVEVKSLSDLRDWLAAHHTRTSGIWLVHHKKASPHYLPIGDIVDECLCWGWIDSLVRAKDDLRTMHYISPRKPASNWSRVNKDKIARLVADGRMQPAGIAMVDLAKTSGTWTALDDVENGVLPNDLRTALKDANLLDSWNALPKSATRGILEILFNTKRAPTRARRISETITVLENAKRSFKYVRKS